MIVGVRTYTLNGAQVPAHDKVTGKMASSIYQVANGHPIQMQQNCYLAPTVFSSIR